MNREAERGPRKDALMIRMDGATQNADEEQARENPWLGVTMFTVDENSPDRFDVGEVDAVRWNGEGFEHVTLMGANRLDPTDSQQEPGDGQIVGVVSNYRDDLRVGVVVWSPSEGVWWVEHVDNVTITSSASIRNRAGVEAADG